MAPQPETKSPNGPNSQCPPPLDESFLTALFNGLSEAVFAVDLATHCIVSWNAGAEAMFGYTDDEALQRTTDFLLPDHESFNRIFKVAVSEIGKHGFWRGEWNYRRRSGVIFPAEVTATLIHPAIPTPQNMSVVVVVLRDISERKELENQIHRLNQELAKRVTETTSELLSARNDLAEAETEHRLTAEQFHLLIQGVSNFAILTLDPRGQIMSWNSGAQRIFGYRESEIIGKPFSLLYQQAEPQAEKFAGVLEKTTVEESFEERARLVGQNGSSIEANILVAPFYDTTGRLLNFTVIVRDVTERVALRKKLQQKEHLAAIGTAAAMFAHEIGNPLNGMSTTVQLLEQSIVKSEFPGKQLIMDNLRGLNDEIRRLRFLLGEFRNLSRPSALDFAPVDLAKLVPDVIKALAANTMGNEQQRLRYVTDLPPGLPLVNGNADKLRQALLNLIKNAAEAMHGEGTITIKAYNSGSHVYLEVTDTGEGIPENVKIFDLFETTKPGGTGLGLVVVQQVVSEHGGSISCISNPQQGTTFRLILPSVNPSKPQ